MNGKHFNNSNKKNRGKIAAIIISVIVVAAIAVTTVILFIPSCGNSSKNTPTATHPSITERTQETTQTAVTEQTSIASTESVNEKEQGTTSQNSGNDDIQESTEEGVPMQSSNSESVVVPGNPENASYFSAAFSPYKAVDSSTDEECSFKEVFGSSYSGGSVVFNSDGSFTDSLTNSSSNSGAYAVEDSKLLATYSNDKNMDVSVTSWNGDAPSEIVINYGGYYVYLN